jgi:hypothetical protein
MSDLDVERRSAGEGILQHECVACHASAAAFFSISFSRHTTLSPRFSRSMLLELCAKFRDTGEVQNRQYNSLCRLSSPFSSILCRMLHRTFARVAHCHSNQLPWLRYLLKTYSNVFLGTTLVDWLTSEGVFERKSQAVASNRAEGAAILDSLSAHL